MKDVPNFTSMTRHGKVWTRQDIIDDVNGWVCPESGLQVTFERFFQSERHYKVCFAVRLPNGALHTMYAMDWLKGYRIHHITMRRHIIEQGVTAYGLVFDGWDSKGRILYTLPNGTQNTMPPCDWVNGHRPKMLDMDRHVIEREVVEYGLEFVGWGSVDRKPHILFNLPSGEPSKMNTNLWRKGCRPKPLDMDRHILEREVKEYGLTFLGLVYRPDQPEIHYALPNGEEGYVFPAHWRKGVRPDGRTGNLSEKVFSRKPELKNLPTILYYRRFEDPARGITFWKIGINQAGKLRFGPKDGDYIITILQETPLSLYEAWKQEQNILKDNRKHKFIPSPLLKRDGNTECFSVDVLGIDTSYKLQEAAD